MPLYLNNDAYIVTGKVKDCIYDLKNARLYHISKEVTKLLDRLLTESVDSLTKEEFTAVEQLQQSGVLVEQEKIQKKSIMTLCKPHRIKTAWIEVTTFCNLKCIHCYEEASSMNSAKMTSEDFRYAIDALSDYGVGTVILIGGEPFCHPDIKEMLLYASQKIPKAAVFTNGTLINEEWCRFLVENRITVGISVYSYSPDMHDRVTLVEGSHARTTHTLELFDKYHISYKIATVHMKDIDLGEKGNCCFRLDPVKDPVRLAGRGKLSLITLELMKYKLITKDRFSLPLDREWVIRALNGHQCFSIKLYIEYNLNVRPCVMEHRKNHGSLRGKTIDQILNPEITDCNKDQIEGCRDCEFRYACHDCRADSMSEYFYAKPYVCTYDPEKGEWENASDYALFLFDRQASKCN